MPVPSSRSSQPAKRTFNKLTRPFEPHLRFVENAIATVKRLGGIPTVVKKMFLIVHREGPRGISKRFKRIAKMKNRRTYPIWINKYDRNTPSTRATLSRSIRQFRVKPLISILMPVTQTQPDRFSTAVQSVLAQIYPSWELWIAIDPTAGPTIRQTAEDFSKKDRRIKTVFLDKKSGEPELFNSALSKSHGDWVTRLGSEDTLSEAALFWVVKTISLSPDAQLLYTDEDKIEPNGARKDHYFKTDWNQDLFYSQDFVGHSGFYRTSLVKNLGGYRPGMEDAWSYDLTLRYIEHIRIDRIHHIPRILYHWGSASGKNLNPFAPLAGVKALNHHFQRLKIKAKAERTPFGFRARYPLPSNPPLVSLIIPTRNGLKLIKTCVNSILQKTTYPHYEILIVDNGSDQPETLAYLGELKKTGKVRVIRDNSPFNYSALNNKAAKAAKGKLLGLLNNDLEVISPDWLSEMVSHALRPEIGAVGAKLYFPNGNVQHAGVVTGIGSTAGHFHKHIPRNDPGYWGRVASIQDFSCVTAACLVIRKSVYQEVHGLDEKNLVVAFNDVDFCLRILEKGYRNLYTPYAELYHYESATRGLDDDPVKRRRFNKEKKYMHDRWGEKLLNDPAYNPNLNIVHEYFGLAWPPRVEAIPRKRK